MHKDVNQEERASERTIRAQNHLPTCKCHFLWLKLRNYSKSRLSRLIPATYNAENIYILCLKVPQLLSLGLLNTTQTLSFTFQV